MISGITNVKSQLIELIDRQNISLIATQERLSFPLIDRMRREMKLGIDFPSIHICEKAIIEGHHRYLASLLAGCKIDQVQGLRSLAKQNIEWSDVQLTDKEYYTGTRIRILNKEDALTLGIKVEELIDKLNEI